MILSAFLLLCCAVATWAASPAAKAAHESQMPSTSERGADADRQAYGTLDQVNAALQRVGLESSNLIIGVDFTKSNQWTGKRCFAGRSLHDLAAGPNPYEEAIGIVGKTLSAYDEDNAIPCFGFGDTSTHDQGVFSFYGDGRPCAGFPEALRRYREIAAAVHLSGPTSLAPIIEAAMGIVQRSGHQYHILLIIADGQVPRGSSAHRASYPDESRSENYMEERTLQALIQASHFPLSIVLIGVGDGPWGDDQMRFHDDRRRFDNFQFVDFTKIMSAEMSRAEKEERFGLEALGKIPSQYAAIIGQRISDLAARAPARTPIPPPS
ncbi:E3 ubiquitin-protein ligase RGLG5-like isoform X2 [Hordeum vulgare subsp. vulgare]|uniref:Copine C-terminal domain-containing protein n=1 Tax=Hordeum vulgare subsp. vulgare TaxID=112509 RepID=A0A8I6Y1Q6_HORVV|nr:E3 ubiquitin-protein ligase RGLG5-like isoform X2 [Hordeum vulgare subsp. vulgare]